MSKEPFNFNFPFVNMMPEDVGDSNFMLDSMKMMSQAWQNFSTITPQSTPNMMDPSELDKRIEELKAVESWLKLNLSMLSSSIHSLEIQKANLEHFSSFMDMMSEPMRAAQAVQAAHASTSKQDQKQEQASSRESNDDATSAQPSEEKQENKSTNDETSDNDAKAAADEASTLMHDQALNWFNLLGDQFKNIVASVSTPPASESSETKDADKDTKKTTKTPAKKATKKTAATKKASRAKKSTATKAASAKKTAAKKSTN